MSTQAQTVVVPMNKAGRKMGRPKMKFPRKYLFRLTSVEKKALLESRSKITA